MAQDIVMPKLAMGMSEGTVVSWKIEQGARVEKGQEVLEIETEKVSYEIEAVVSGFLNILVAEGETVPVDTPIAQIADSAEKFGAAPVKAEVSSDITAADPVQEKPQAAPQAPEAAAPATTQAPEAAAPATTQAPEGRIIASPLAKKMAANADLDLTLVAGTGPNGRIVKRDVLNALSSREEAGASVPAAMSTPSVMPAAKTVKATIPVKGMRKAIADNLMHSLSTSAQLSVTSEFDATELVALRQRLLAKEEKIGLRVSFTDLFVLIVSRAAKQVPIVNASLVGEEICIWENVNLGIAVALDINEYESGLIVPVVMNASRKSLFEISRDVQDLSVRARTGGLSSEEMSHGTITLSSAAFLEGMVMSTPVLNPGQAMLVQPGPIQEKPVVVNGEIVIRPMISVSLTADHRIVDGVPLGRFNKAIKELIEDPEMLL